MKVVGFTIEIKGQKDILATTKILGLLNTQLILINSSLIELYKTSGTLGRQLNKQFKGTSSSVKKLGTVVKSSFQTFEKGNKVVQQMGSGFAEVTKQVDKTAKELKDLDKATEQDSKSIKELIKRNKELKNVLESQPLDKTSKELRKLEKEYTKNTGTIKKFRKELKTGVKASEQSATSLNGLKDKAARLKKEYNQLSSSQKKFTIQGIALGKSLTRTNKKIAKLNRNLRGSKKLSKTLSSTFTKLFIGSSILSGVGALFSRIGSGLKTIVEEGGQAGATFETLQKSGAGLQNTLKTVGTNFLKTFGGGIAKVINNISFVISVVSNKFKELSESGGAVGKIFSAIGALFTEFPAIIGGVGSVFSAFVDSIKAKF